MKKILFIISLFVIFSAKVMSFMPHAEEELSKQMCFKPLAPEELLKQNYPLDMSAETKIEADGVNFLLPILEIGTATKDIEITYRPYEFSPSMLLPIGVPIGLATDFMMCFLSRQPYPSTLDLSMESNVINQNTRETVGKKITKVTLPPEKLADELRHTMRCVQAAGNKKVLEKNKDLLGWVKQFLTDDFVIDVLKDDRRGNRASHYINAARMFAYCFSGKVDVNPDNDTMLRARILGKELVLGRVHTFPSSELYTLAKIAVFRKFLQDMGFYLEGDKLKIRQ